MQRGNIAMYKRRKPYEILAILLILLIFIPLSNANDGHYPTAMIVGKPLITTAYSDYAKLSVDQILAVDETIYILYDEHKGIIQVFDKNGMYQYTTSFYKHTNGAFGMAVHDGILYVRDCIHNIYSLKDGILIEFYERDAVPVWMQQLDFQASSPDFRVRLGSVWYVTAENEYCFIRRPLLAALYQNNLLFFLAVTLIVMIGIYKGCRLHFSKSHKAT